MIRFLIPIQTVSESNRRDHWAKKAARAKLHRQTAWRCAVAGIRNSPLPAIIKLTRVSVRELDDDNLRGALKAARDGIADRFKLDDRNHLFIWQYDQKTVKKGSPEIGVLVEIWPQ